MRKSYSSAFKLKAASMVLDEGQSVPEYRSYVSAP